MPAKPSMPLVIPQGSYSILLTQEEFVAASMWRWKQAHRQTPWTPLLLAAGSVLATVGVLSMLELFLPPSFGWALAFGLLCWGVELAYLPLLAKGRAMRQFLEREELHTACKYTFEGDTVRIDNARVSGTLPLSKGEAFDTGMAVGWDFGGELLIILPRRILEDL